MKKLLFLSIGLLSSIVLNAGPDYRVYNNSDFDATVDFTVNNPCPHKTMTIKAHTNDGHNSSCNLNKLEAKLSNGKSLIYKPAKSERKGTYNIEEGFSLNRVSD